MGLTLEDHGEFENTRNFWHSSETHSPFMGEGRVGVTSYVFRGLHELGLE